MACTTDTYTATSKKWEVAWEFYLHGPLEEYYELDGDIDTLLFLYSDEVSEVKLKIVIYDVTEDGKKIAKLSKVFNDVELGGESPEDPVIFNMGAQKKKKFDEGHSIMLEVSLKGEAGDNLVLDYDSENQHSRIEFPGMIMPESLLPLLILAPVIPGIVVILRGRKNDV